MRVNLKQVESTQGGKSRFLACKAAMACKGLTVVVDTASMTAKQIINQVCVRHRITSYWRQDGSNLQSVMAGDHFQHTGVALPTTETSMYPHLISPSHGPILRCVD